MGPPAGCIPLRPAGLSRGGILRRRDAYSITTGNRQSLLDWLGTQVTAGAVAVETTGQVIGGTYKPPFCC